MPVYLIGRFGEGGPGLATCRDLAGLLETVPRLDPGEYWIAFDLVMWGTAVVHSPQVWDVEGRDNFRRTGRGWPKG